MTKTNVKNIWEVQSDFPEQMLSRERVLEIDSINCYICTIQYTKTKLFTVEVDDESTFSYPNLKRFSGVEIQIVSFKDDKKELAIVLLENDLLDIFVLFINDLIDSLIDVPNSKVALSVISKRIAFWRKLFGKISGDILSAEQIRGLYGELYFFKKLLEYQIHPSYLLNAWQAPQAENQDYYFPNNAIEIKTTKSNSPIISISNEFQLNLNGFDHIFLVFYHINEHPGTNNTLFQLINQIRELLEPSQELMDVFNIKLLGLGIDKELEEEYDRTSFSIINERNYEIKNDFPRIIPEMIQSSVSKVSYCIDPIGCKDFEIEFDAILNIIDNHGTC